MEKVVKCNRSQCGQYFGHTEKKTKCPFCHTVYSEVEEKDKEKKEATRTQKNLSKFGKIINII